MMKSTGMENFGDSFSSHGGFSPFPTGGEKPASSHIKKMGLIAASCIAIALAGLLTRASFAVNEDSAHPSSSDFAQAPLVAKPLEPARAETLLLPGNATSDEKRSQASTQESRFAHKQLVLYSTLIETLQERMNEESNADHLARMKAAISALNQNLDESRAALASYESHRKDPIAKEELKSHLFALQETGQKAVSVFIDADNFALDEGDESLQVFNVSRTGQ